MKPDIDTIWQRVRQHEGEVFHLKGGGAFIYEVDDLRLLISRPTFAERKQWTVTQPRLAEALPGVPYERPGAIKTDSYGRSYIWGLLHDPRIRKGDY